MFPEGSASGKEPYNQYMKKPEIKVNINLYRASAYGTMERQIDISWCTLWAISHFSQCSATGVTNGVRRMVHIKEIFMLI